LTRGIVERDRDENRAIESRDTSIPAPREEQDSLSEATWTCTPATSVLSALAPGARTALGCRGVRRRAALALVRSSNTRNHACAFCQIEVLSRRPFQWYKRTHSTLLRASLSFPSSRRARSAHARSLSPPCTLRSGLSALYLFAASATGPLAARSTLSSHLQVHVAHRCMQVQASWNQKSPSCTRVVGRAHTQDSTAQLLAGPSAVQAANKADLSLKDRLQAQAWRPPARAGAQ